jgi:hypothetical protein
MKKDDIHFLAALLVNITIVALIINYVWTSDSDKSVIVFIIFYPLLTLMNIVIWIIMRLSNDDRYKSYRWTTIALIVGFIPASIALTMN